MPEASELGTEQGAEALLMQVREDMGHLEGAFAAASAALEDLPQKAWPLFLAKLVLLLSDKIGDGGAVADAVAIAARDLDRG